MATSSLANEDQGRSSACQGVKKSAVKKWSKKDKENPNEFSTFIVRMLDRYKPEKSNRYLRKYLDNKKGKVEPVLTCLTWFHSEKQARRMANDYNSKSLWSRTKSNVKGILLSPVSSRYNQYDRSVRKGKNPMPKFPDTAYQGFLYRPLGQQGIYRD